MQAYKDMQTNRVCQVVHGQHAWRELGHAFMSQLSHTNTANHTQTQRITHKHSESHLQRAGIACVIMEKNPLPTVSIEAVSFSITLLCIPCVQQGAMYSMRVV